MTTVQVRDISRKPTTGSAVVWTGDDAEARLLQQAGWVTGTDIGDSKDNSGGPVLRGLLGNISVYPGDYLVQETGKPGVKVFTEDQYIEMFTYLGDGEVLANDEEISPGLDSVIPTGVNPEAVNLEQTTPEEVNNLIAADQLRELAARADDEDIEAADEFRDIALANNVDPDTHPSEDWAGIAEDIIATTPEIKVPVAEDDPDNGDGAELELMQPIADPNAPTQLPALPGDDTALDTGTVEGEPEANPASDPGTQAPSEGEVSPGDTPADTTTDNG